MPKFCEENLYGWLSNTAKFTNVFTLIVSRYYMVHVCTVMYIPNIIIIIILLHKYSICDSLHISYSHLLYINERERERQNIEYAMLSLEMEGRREFGSPERG